MAETAKEWLDSLSEEQLQGFIKHRGELSEGGDDEYVSKASVRKMIQDGIKKGVEDALGTINPRLGAVSQSQGMALLTAGLKPEEAAYIEETFKDKKDADILSIAMDKPIADTFRLAAKQHAYQKNKASDDLEIDGTKKTPAAKDSAELEQYKKDMAPFKEFKDDAEALESMNRTKGITDTLQSAKDEVKAVAV